MASLYDDGLRELAAGALAAEPDASTRSESNRHESAGRPDEPLAPRAVTDLAALPGKAWSALEPFKSPAEESNYAEAYNRDRDAMLAGRRAEFGTQSGPRGPTPLDGALFWSGLAANANPATAAAWTAANAASGAGAFENAAGAVASIPYAGLFKGMPHLAGKAVGHAMVGGGLNMIGAAPELEAAKARRLSEKRRARAEAAYGDRGTGGAAR